MHRYGIAVFEMSGEIDDSKRSNAPSLLFIRRTNLVQTLYIFQRTRVIVEELKSFLSINAMSLSAQLCTLDKGPHILHFCPLFCYTMRRCSVVAHEQKRKVERTVQCKYAMTMVNTVTIIQGGLPNSAILGTLRVVQYRK